MVSSRVPSFGGVDSSGLGYRGFFLGKCNRSKSSSFSSGILGLGPPLPFPLALCLAIASRDGFVLAEELGLLVK